MIMNTTLAILDPVQPEADPAQTGEATSQGELVASDLSFTLSADDAANAARRGIPVNSISEVRTLLLIMEAIHAAKKKRPECERQAKLCAFRWSTRTLEDKYLLFMRGNRDFPRYSWQLLLNKAKAPVGRRNDAVMKYQFLEFWRKLGEENQRCWSGAHTELVQIFKTGYGFPRNNRPPKHYKKIPGYATWPEAEADTGLPAGWSLGNLMRHTSEKYDQVAARVGRSKASEHRLPVLTSRIGQDGRSLKFGAYFEFDDHEFNQKVMFQKKPMRPLGFGAVELLSGCLCHVGYKPTLWNYEDEVKQKLTEREFMWFVVSHLCSVGYRNDATGTELIVERGTAAIRSEFRERIERVFGGRVRVWVGGRFGRGAHDGQFKGASKGNFKTKRLVEGMWSLVDNQSASLPAQVGKDRNHSPEQLYGIEQYVAATQRRAEAAGLSPERLALLEFPVMNYSVWRDAQMELVRRVNACRQHKLEGWEKLGFIIPIWRFPELPGEQARWLPWSHFDKLPEDQKPVVRAMLDANPELLSTVRLSRQDIFNARRRELTQAPFELLPELVGIENALNGGKPVEVKKGLFSFDDAEMDADTLHFTAKDVGSRTAHNHLANGDEYILFANPYDPRFVVACNENAGGKLRVAAVCPRYEVPCVDDEKAVIVSLGNQAAWEGAAHERLNRRHADKGTEIRRMKSHNDAVINGAPITPQEKVAARKAAARRRDLTEHSDISELADPRPDAAAPQANVSEAVPPDDFSVDALLQ